MATPSRSKSSPRVTIEVTQEIVDASTRRDSSHCMIAEALQRAVPKAQYISVDLATIRFTDMSAGRRYVYLTPRVAQEALLAFDQGEKIEPFTVRIQGAHVLATGNARKARATLKPGQVKDSVPIRTDGLAPPIGPLASGTGTNPSNGKGDRRTGRRREFGLRAIIR